MAPVRNGGSTDEVSDEEYLILHARSCRETDPYAAKAWLITAKTLFPSNFDIQFEVYTNEKVSRNVREAAKYLEDLFRNFKSHPGMWEEVEVITEALQAETTDITSCFLREVFSMLPADVQHEILLETADRSDDTQEHSKLLLLLLKKFPDKIVLHGLKLVDTLVTAEKHGHPKSPVNCFRKLLVCDILPLIFQSSGIDFPLKQIYNHLHKCVEFYANYIMQPVKNQTVSFGILQNEMTIENPWDQLGNIFHAVGQRLNWDLKDLFISSSKEHQWQRIQSFHQNLPLDDSNTIHTQIFYSTCILFLQCLYEYTSKADPEQFAAQGGNNSSLPSLILIDGFRPGSESPDQPKLKKRRLDLDTREEIPPTLHVSKIVQNASSVITHNFLIATRCWDLFYSTEALEKDFKRFQQQLQMEGWPWFVNFQLDRLIYQSQYQEAVSKLQQLEGYGPTPYQNKINIRLASCYSGMGMSSMACERILSVVGALPKKSSSLSNSSGHSNLGPAYGSLSNSSGPRQLFFINYDRQEILQFCVRLILNCFKDQALEPTAQDDMALGHLLVLAQYEWPATEPIFLHVIEKIKAQGSFTYNLFFNYVINIDMLEEFAHLSKLGGGSVNLDLLPVSVTQIAKQRTVTRGVNKGAKEDFRSAMERQVGRCEESLDLLLIQFLTQERNLLQL